MTTTNQRLQRLADLNGGTNNNNNNNTDCPTQQQQTIQQNITSSPTTAVKKRKLDQVMTVQTISDSSDEGLGSMSPDPTFDNGTNTKTQMVSAAVTTVTVKDYVNLQNQMETERRHRIQLEEQLKQLESQFYSSERVQYHNPQKYHTFHHQEVIEHTNNLQHDEVDEVDGDHHPMEQKIIMRGSGPIIQDTDCHYTTMEGMSQFVVINTPSTPKHHMIVDDDDNSRTLSSDELHKDDNKMVRVTECKVSPKHHQHHKQLQHLEHHQVMHQVVKGHMRIPSILEQAIKAEPKVEVERINSPSTLTVQINENAVQSPPRNNSPVTMTITRNNSHMRTTYPCNSSRPNLETIVEAIRHLEGDVLFEMDGDDNNSSAAKRSYSPTQPQPQDVPLALTTNNKYQDTNNIGDADEEDEDHPFLKFRTSAPSHAASLPTFSISVPQKVQQTTMHIQQQQQQQCYRPGVIVVKQSS